MLAVLAAAFIALVSVTTVRAEPLPAGIDALRAARASRIAAPVPPPVPIIDAGTRQAFTECWAYGRHFRSAALIRNLGVDAVDAGDMLKSAQGVAMRPIVASVYAAKPNATPDTLAYDAYLSCMTKTKGVSVETAKAMAAPPGTPPENGKSREAVVEWASLHVPEQPDDGTAAANQKDLAKWDKTFRNGATKNGPTSGSRQHTVVKRQLTRRIP